MFIGFDSAFTTTIATAMAMDITTKGDIYREGRAAGQAIRSIILPMPTTSPLPRNTANQPKLSLKASNRSIDEPLITLTRSLQSDKNTKRIQ